MREREDRNGRGSRRGTGKMRRGRVSRRREEDERRGRGQELAKARD